MYYQKLEKTIKERKISMNKLAKEAGFSQASTDRWKKGSLPNTEALIKICKYLNVSADYLLDLNDETPPPMSDQEQQLLEYFRQCDDGTQKSILLLARSGAEEAETKKLLTSQNIG
jgi:transcriptional regulator with XRE-family HTH domain